MVIRAALLLVSCAWLASCGNSSSDPLAAATIGPAGGTLSVSDGRVAITVPAGALDRDLGLRIDPGQISRVPGFVDVGPAYLFSPAATTFAAAAQVVLPFDPARVPSTVGVGELRIGLRTSTGQVTALLPGQVDMTLGRISIETLQLGTFWVAAPDLVSAADLFPLGDGDSYRFDSGLVVTVARTAAEPNIAPLEVAKLTLTRPGRAFGYYLDDRNGELAKVGQWTVRGSQERNDSPVLLIGAREFIGNSRVEIGTFLGFWPFGTSIVAYTGLEQVTTELAARERIATQAGTFDTVRVRIDTLWTITPGGQGADAMELWLAPGVGPVQLRFDDGLNERLRSAVIGGVPIGQR
jgi:hypothetical protein